MVNAAQYGTVVVAVVSLAGAITAYLKSKMTETKVSDHIRYVHGAPDYTPPKGK